MFETDEDCEPSVIQTVLGSMNPLLLGIPGMLAQMAALGLPPACDGEFVDEDETPEERDLRIEKEVLREVGSPESKEKTRQYELGDAEKELQEARNASDPAAIERARAKVSGLGGEPGKSVQEAHDDRAWHQALDDLDREYQAKMAAWQANPRAGTCPKRFGFEEINARIEENSFVGPRMPTE